MLFDRRTILLCLFAGLCVFAREASADDSPLALDLRRLEKLPAGVDQWQWTTNRVAWDVRHSAAVICDMWDKHWCRQATARVAEMAPHINDFVCALRARGVLIIHCPSDTMAYYTNAPGRKLAEAAPKVETAVPLKGWCDPDPAREPPLPIDDSDGGCNDDPPCPQGSPWRHEIDSIKIEPGDAITDNAEAYYLMRARGITNVFVMGVHENMCVLGRPFSIRQMVGQGLNVTLVRDLTDTMYNSRRKPYVDHFTGTDLVTWHIEKYWCPTMTSDQILGGEPFRFAADTNPPRVFRNYVKLPASDTHAKQVASYVEETPNPDYSQAPESSRQAFREIKFGVRIHWGVYSELGVDASWPFLKMDNAHRQAYQQMYRAFNPTNFNADSWMDFFQTNGARVVAFTSKHHDGFSMFDTKTRVARRVNWTNADGPQIENCDFAYSIMDTPFHRDIVKEVCDAAHRHGMKIDLYFSHPDWYDADFRPFAEHPLHDRVDKAAHPDQWNHFVQRHRQQLTELLSNYGNIDMMCLDQYFDETAWLDLRQTMKIIRKIQPDVMFRCRGIGNYGDYYTPEGFVPGAKANTDMPWMVIYPLAENWSYQPDVSVYHDGNWIVTNLIDAVAKGGNFMVGFGPDATGNFHPKAVQAMEYAGAWLKVNGESIFDTVALPGGAWKDAGGVRYTRGEHRAFVYALPLQWPGDELRLAKARLAPGATVRMLGVDEPLAWRPDGDKGIVVAIPPRLRDAAGRPCAGPPVFRFDSSDIVIDPSS